MEVRPARTTDRGARPPLPGMGTLMSIVAGAGPAGRAADAGPPTDDHAEHAAGRPRSTPAPVRTPRTLAAAGDLLRALAAPVRIAIVLQLLESDRCVHDLVDALAVAQPLISQHLRVLKSAGVVHGERRGREVVYSLVDDHLAHIVVDAVAHVEEG
ncbi:ArsR family transcriptional regulator [Pseudonocardia cypriaca]|jgi:ArsR family transcriptional regulator, zinc-responsive transcriptional repressor|uniref:ArsR family transcriptional regulator n=2 Tax=Pseudonocardia cypriaca TaxID=882449 RepID=A0A543FV75_9PSEU|nr:ArsR family transcriptional regulator [Pseudonocardia cypriaca]